MSQQKVVITTTGKTHIVGGILVGLIVTQALEINAGYSVVAGVSALFPDIDQPTSKIGQRIPGSFLIKLIFGHRNFWHSLLAALLLFLAFSSFLPQHFAVLVLAGYLSHLLLDMLTPAGVPLFYPFTKRFSIPLTKTGGLIEYLFLGVMFAMSIMIILI